MLRWYWQDHTQLWLSATMMSLGMTVLSDIVKIVATSAVSKYSDRVYDAASETLQSIVSTIVNTETSLEE